MGLVDLLGAGTVNSQALCKYQEWDLVNQNSSCLLLEPDIQKQQIIRQRRTLQHVNLFTSSKAIRPGKQSGWCKMLWGTCSSICQPLMSQFGDDHLGC